jgi:hypothetical protein
MASAEGPAAAPTAAPTRRAAMSDGALQARMARKEKSETPARLQR